MCSKWYLRTRGMSHCQEGSLHMIVYRVSQAYAAGGLMSLVAHGSHQVQSQLNKLQSEENKTQSQVNKLQSEAIRFRKYF
jgi:hypothetical protein